MRRDLTAAFSKIGEEEQKLRDKLNKPYEEWEKKLPRSGEEHASSRWRRRSKSSTSELRS